MMPEAEPKQSYDCVVIGGGPAGLTAAIYLARFLLKVAVIDAGKSRALWIARTHNHAGYPDGISGKQLLGAMRKQAEKYGAKFVKGEVKTMEKSGDGFLIEYGSGKVGAARILLATGLINRRPEMSEDDHARGLATGCIRYCAICDGFEIRDQPVAVIGSGEAALSEARFLRSYTDKVTIFPAEGSLAFTDDAMREAERLGVKLATEMAEIHSLDEEEIVLKAGGQLYRFRSLYPAFGSDVNSLLADLVGADTNDLGCIKVDNHQRTSVKGLYAAGDVVIGLDQISHAMGEGGVAATTIRNDLAAERELLR